MSGSHDAPATPAALREELAVANHILFHQGVVDGFGHVSLRHPTRPDCFLLARSMAPALVTADDIICFALDAEPLDAAGRPVYLERFIHSEIFRARPEVMSVVHSHSPSVVPFGVVQNARLCPICHMSGFLAPVVPVFEIRDTAGPASDMLIRDHRLGAALARSLGPHAAVLMRGHGATVVGTSLRQAVFRAVYTEVNAKLQAEAMRLGPVTFLTDAEAAAASRTNDGQIDRAWNLWHLQVEAKVRALPPASAGAGLKPARGLCP
jgi:ribulose-5-phosphate 4-epimerase/fuculose-1-phosphate aldolase